MNTPTPAHLKMIRERIESDLEFLRAHIPEPVSIRFGEHVDFEIRPAEDDDRMLVGREDWGFVSVNYTSEGVIVDVIDNDANVVREIAVDMDELISPED